MESFERIGNFWFPENEEEIFNGILKFNPTDGGSLELIHGRLTSCLHDKFHNTKNLTILGIIKNTKYTLLNCSPTSYDVFDIYTRFSVTYIIAGEHYNNIETTKFNSLCLTISGLNYWANHEIMDVNIDEFFEYPKCETAVTFKIPPKQKFESKIDETFNLEFFTSADMKQDGIQQTWSFNKNPYFIFKFLNPKNIEEINKTIYHLCNFMSFTTLKPMYVLELTSNDPKIIFYFKRKYAVKDLSNHIQPHDMLFTLSDIINLGFDEALKNWFANHEELNHIYRLFLSPDYTNSVLEVSFLSLAQALDSYLTFFLNGKGLDKKILSKNEIRNIKKMILKENFHVLESDPEYKQLFDYFDSFENRINLLLSEYKTVFAGIDDIGDLTKIICETRNSNSHGDSDEEKESNPLCYTGYNLFGLYSGIRMILSAVFLRRIGFDDNKIIESLKRYFWYKNILKGDFKFKSKSN